jgi:type I restriction enzyme S subunit
VLRPDPRRLASDYLFHWVRGPFFIAEMVRRATGASYPAVSDKIVQGSRLPVPTLEEQTLVAEILNTSDKMWNDRQLTLKRLDELTAAVFIEMFGDVYLNPKKWAVMPFRDVCENHDSFRRPVKAADRDGRKGEYPYYGASGIIDYVDGFLFDGDRLLIGEDGANLLARSTPIAFLASGRYWVNNHAHVLAYNGKAELKFLESFINQISLKPYVTGSAQPKLNQANLERIPVPTPPVSLQREFVNKIEECSRVKSLCLSHLNHLQALFTTLQQRAFNGELTSKHAESQLEMAG